MSNHINKSSKAVKLWAEIERLKVERLGWTIAPYKVKAWWREFEKINSDSVETILNTARELKKTGWYNRRFLSSSYGLK